jgi:hypothetical protein
MPKLPQLTLGELAGFFAFDICPTRVEGIERTKKGENEVNNRLQTLSNRTPTISMPFVTPTGKLYRRPDLNEFGAQSEMNSGKLRGKRTGPILR